MKNWKQAFWLAKFELKASMISLFLSLIAFLFIIFIITTTFDSYLEKNFVGLDAFFVLIFTIAPVWAKPKKFQIQQMGNELVAAPTVVMLSQLPVPLDIIAKSRFIVSLFYMVPIQIILLCSVYFFNPAIQTMMPIHAYLSFAIIWLSFGIYIGGIFPAGDAGDKASSLKIALYAVLMIGSGILIFTLIHIVFGHGIIQWTLIFAQKQPFLSSFLSILLAFVGFTYWQFYMKKTMRKMDYL